MYRLHVVMRPGLVHVINGIHREDTWWHKSLHSYRTSIQPCFDHWCRAGGAVVVNRGNCSTFRFTLIEIWCPYFGTELKGGVCVWTKYVKVSFEDGEAVSSRLSQTGFTWSDHVRRSHCSAKRWKDQTISNSLMLWWASCRGICSGSLHFFPLCFDQYGVLGTGHELE